jgi:acyl-CoA reductase-like NAD-dependent aldehyde dehydrogenase
VARFARAPSKTSSSGPLGASTPTARSECPSAARNSPAATVVTGPGSVVGEEIIRHPAVRKIGFTGETGTGRQVMASAAQEIKRVTLELGGSDPAIVCDDADLEVAAKSIAIGRFFNAGQACLAVKRVYVQEAVADEFLDKLVGRARRLKIGNGDRKSVV